MTARGAIDPMVLEEAADWLMRLSEGALAPEEQAQWLHWRSSNSECERAWQRAEGLLGKLGGLPPALAMPALNRPRGLARRAVLARLAALLALGPAAWGGWQLNQRQGWSADYHAAVGERRALRLGDGSQVTLNTDTSLDVRFDARERLLVLRRGEILVQTAADAQLPGRPLRVMTDQGRLEALGTRFSVREDGGQTRLAVFEGAVRIDRPGLAPRVVDAGQRLAFSARLLGEPVPADLSLVAWTQGMLVADRMPLSAFVAELARYRHGVLRCDPAIADLRVSGAFPLDDTRHALTMLALTYPLTVTQRLHGYWVMLAPA